MSIDFVSFSFSYVPFRFALLFSFFVSFHKTSEKEKKKTEKGKRKIELRRISSVPNLGIGCYRATLDLVEIRYLKNRFSNRPCENPTTKKPTTKTSTLSDIPSSNLP